ncbi:hypothetical protein AC1031_008043 [Aphanomyces cochlioides]|nr:hypothetical protein AC1031_008043 [Aphanomyces cochlioides]
MAEASLVKVLDLSHVVFPPDEEAYRVHSLLPRMEISHCICGSKERNQKSNGNNIAGIVLDNVVLIRVCTVTDLTTHAPRDADYVLPFSTVKTYLMRGLRALDRATKVDRKDCNVRLARSTSGETTMTLTMTALDPLKVVYSFTLEEKSVKFVDVLDAKIRDLQEAMPIKLDLTTTWLFESTGETVANDPIQWKALTALPPGARLNSTSITLFKTGLYLIQFSGTMPYWSNGYGVGLHVSGEPVTHTPCGHDGRANSLLYLLKVTKSTLVCLSVFGKSTLAANASLTIVLLQEY